MKKALTIGAIVLLAGAFLHACGIIPNVNTSLVTLRIGDSRGQAMLRAEAATPWVRMKQVLAGLKLMPEAQAYIPSVVDVLVVTVTAADMPVPIVGVAAVSSGQTSATVRLDVPNGAGRQFLVEGYRGADSQVYFSGVVSNVELTGAELTMPVSMNFAGPGIWVSPTGNDTSGAGTQANPYQTISRALSATSGTDAILVTAGTYTLTAGAGPATLQLKPYTALVCLGTGFSTVIDASNTVDDLIYGNEGASVDNCRLIPGSDTTAIDDRIGGAQGNIPARMRINGVLIDADQQVGGALDGIMLSADSLVVETTVLNTTWHGITVLGGTPAILDAMLQDNPIGIELAGGDPQVSNVLILNPTAACMTGINITSAGKPVISGGTIADCSTGIDLAAGAGDALITGATITGNTAGIALASAGTPTVTLSRITNNGTGIQVSGGNPSISSNVIRNNTGTGISIIGSARGQVSGNSIDHNSTGVVISVATGGDPRVTGNSIYCNAFTGADVSAMTAIHLENNAWNRDANTSPPGPRVDIGNCLAGADICPRSVPDPIYIPFSAAAVNGCP